MSEFNPINFEPVHKGVGYYSDLPPSSYYDVQDEDQLLSTSMTDVFKNTDFKSLNYDELVEHLERPILDDFKNQKHLTPYLKPAVLKPEVSSEKESQEEVQMFVDQNIAVNSIGLPEWNVLKLDYSFSLGLYLLGGVMVSVLFGSPYISSLLFASVGFGLFHQIYLIVSRSILGASLGEERYNLAWRKASPWNFILRGLIVTLTGFVLIPFFSALLKRDLLKEYTGLQLEYNV